jgi:nucleotide-binding universal stress UspA family protein
LTYKKILVTLDGSEVAEAAIPYARLIAKTLDSELLLVTICAPKCDDRFKRFCQAYLDLKVTELKPHAIKTSSAVIHGNIAEKIIEFSLKNGIDLLVVASRGYSGFKRFTMGSVTRQIIHRSYIPTIIVKPTYIETKKAKLKKILVPLDGSMFSEKSVLYIDELAKRNGAEIILLTISRPPEIRSDRPAAIKPTWEEYRDAVLKEAELQGIKYLDRVKIGLQEKGVKVKLRFLFGEVVENILKVAEDEQVDLIAMATHGRTGADRWFYGTITGKIVDDSPRPVLIIHPNPQK